MKLKYFLKLHKRHIYPDQFKLEQMLIYYIKLKFGVKISNERKEIYQKKMQIFLKYDFHKKMVANKIKKRLVFWVTIQFLHEKRRIQLNEKGNDKFQILAED